MTPNYLLPCSCGEKIIVQKRQAGERVYCVCGRRHDLPGMRQISQLEPCDSTQPAEMARVNNAESWSKNQGMMFFAGGILLLLGIVIGTVYGLNVYRVQGKLSTARPEIPTELWQQEADKLKPYNAWETWKAFSDLEKYPLRYDKPTHVINREFFRR